MLQQDLITYCISNLYAMNKNKLLIATLVAVVAFLSIGSVQAKEKGFWIYYEYTETIPVGQGAHHECNHPGASDAYASVVSSTGKYTMRYEWDKPTLEVWISNDDTTPITVTWREYFYET